MNWQEINEVTWKLHVDGEISRTSHRHGMWAGWDAPRARAWVIRIGPHWFARFKNKAVGPLTIGKAKKAAEALVHDGFEGKAQTVSDPIKWLNHISVREIIL